MANWKKVDADQLDADLTTVADAIRERADVAEELAFPDGFVSGVERGYTNGYNAGYAEGYELGSNPPEGDPVYFLEQGTHEFSSNGVKVTVSEGNRVHYVCDTVGTSKVNILKLSENSTSPSDGWGNAGYKSEKFKINAGDTFKIAINQIGNKLTKDVRFNLTRANATSSIGLCILSAGVSNLESAVTMPEDYPVGAIYMDGGDNDFEFDFKCYVNGNRFI